MVRAYNFKVNDCEICGSSAKMEASMNKWDVVCTNPDCFLSYDYFGHSTRKEATQTWNNSTRFGSIRITRG